MNILAMLYIMSMLKNGKIFREAVGILRMVEFKRELVCIWEWKVENQKIFKRVIKIQNLKINGSIMSKYNYLDWKKKQIM